MPHVSFKKDPNNVSRYAQVCQETNQLPYVQVCNQLRYLSLNYSSYAIALLSYRMQDEQETKLIYK